MKISCIDASFLLKTFLSYFEIFLNEFRKYLFAKGEIEHEDEPSQPLSIGLNLTVFLH